MAQGKNLPAPLLLQEGQVLGWMQGHRWGLLAGLGQLVPFSVSCWSFSSIKGCLEEPVL